MPAADHHLDAVRARRDHALRVLQARTACRRLGFRYEGLLRGGTRSKWLCRATAGGRRFVVKSGRPEEVAVLRLWQGSRHVVRLAGQVDRRVYAMEELAGVSLYDLPDQGVSHARAIGRAVADAHRPAPPSLPARLPELEEWLSAGVHVDPAVERYAQSVRRAILTTDHPRQVLHGDLVGGNMFCFEGSITLFDPLGRWGGAAYDLTRFCTMTPGHDPVRTMRELAVGYGRELPLLGHYFVQSLLLHYGYLVPRHPGLSESQYPLEPVEAVVRAVLDRDPAGLFADLG